MAKSDRGFASMPKSRVKEIAAKGGRASGKARRKKKKKKQDEEDMSAAEKTFHTMNELEVEELTK